MAHLSETPLIEATRGPDADEWLNAIADELRSILKNDTWTTVPRPQGERILGSRIVLRNKFDQEGTLKRRKARIVAQGFAQRPGIDYDDAFAPVSRIESVRMMAALAAEHDMSIEHYDVTTAFLNGKLKEKVYLEIPKCIHEGLENLIQAEPRDNKIRAKAEKMLTDLKSGDKVCLLSKAIYGLRQAGRCWHSELSEALLAFGTKRSSADPCVFYQGHGKEIMLIVTYVDDILVACRDKSRITALYQHLSKKFEMKNLGQVQHCLGMEFSRNDSKISITQKGYITCLLKRFGMSDAKPVSTPLEPNSKLQRPDTTGSEDTTFPYQELIGSLMYLAICTRPDIAHAINYLSQFNTKYDSTHWSAAKRVLRYLKGTPELGLTYQKTGKPACGYVDADWANCITDRKSFTGYAFTLSGCPISWASRKQKTAALSSVEAEYMALTEAAKEAAYLKRLLLELGHSEKAKINVLCDNTGAIKLAENPVFHSRTKHIDIRHHYVREALEKGIITIEYLETNEMAADVLTKGLPRSKYEKCLRLLGILA